MLKVAIKWTVLIGAMIASCLGSFIIEPIARAYGLVNRVETPSGEVVEVVPFLFSQHAALALFSVLVVWALFDVRSTWQAARVRRRKPGTVTLYNVIANRPGRRLGLVQIGATSPAEAAQKAREQGWEVEEVEPAE